MVGRLNNIKEKQRIKEIILPQNEINEKHERWSQDSTFCNIYFSIWSDEKTKANVV